MPATDLTLHPQPHREPSRHDGAQIRQEGSRFADAHVTGGLLCQGNFVGLTINSTAVARPDYAGHFAHSSLAPVKAFVARDTLHDQIHTQLDTNAADASTRTLVVWGLGGAGKTQLVLDYVRRHRAEYKATFWIEAGRKESLERDIVHLYQTLFGLTAAAGAETVGVEDALTGVKSWFSGRQGPWLMVFDGADAIEDSTASGYIDIRHFIPDVASLHVIVTSRSSAAGDMTQLEGVRVGEMEEGQAVELFYRYSKLPRDDAGIRDEVTVIVRELGCLALAVTLAAAYVGTTPRLQSDIRAYLPEYRQRRRELLKRKPESLVHQYSESVLTTWETSYRAVSEQRPEASVLMTMLSCLSFDDIFLGLFGIDGQVGDTRRTDDNVDSDYVSWRRLISPEQSLDGYRIEECFRVLQKYSLVQWKADQQSYAMHKLVHAWGFDRLTGDEQHKISQVAFGLVLEVVEAIKDSRAAKDKLRVVPHVMANFAALGGGSGGWKEVTEGLLDELERVSLFLEDVGKWSEEHAVQEIVLDERRRILGEEHPSTISAMGNLATTLGDQGQLDEAAKMKKEVLEKMRRILGEEHPSTISAMGNLAITLGDQGQLDKAAKMLNEVLEKRRRILGEEHRDTISAMNNLASTLRDQGQLDEAAEMKKEVLEKVRRILGEEHPSTITAMNNLATTLADQGQLDKAAKMKKEVLEKRRQILGEEHPDTISTMNNLANTLRDQGQLDKAAKMKKEVLEKRRRILGEEHPGTIAAMSNLASTLRDQGQLDEAAEMMKEVLERGRRILGDEHPDTISAMNNLATTLGDQGQLDEAAKMKKEVLEKMRRILGEEHPSTISAMNNLATTLRDQGQLDEAAKMKKEVLEKMRRILGEEHRDTISAMNNLANTLGDQGQLDKAAKMLKEVLEKRRRILGEEHPSTISAMNNLATTLGDQGRLDEAAKMKKEVLEKMRRILGEEHPSTISAMGNLAITLGDQGQLDEAAKMLKEVLEKRRRILGEEHPDTISAMNNLASTLGDQGQLDEAAKMFKEVLEKRRQILGEEHPRTRAAAQNLDIVVQRQSVRQSSIHTPSRRRARLLKLLGIRSCT